MLFSVLLFLSRFSGRRVLFGFAVFAFQLSVLVKPSQEHKNTKTQKHRNERTQKETQDHKNILKNQKEKKTLKGKKKSNKKKDRFSMFLEETVGSPATAPKFEASRRTHSNYNI